MLAAAAARVFRVPASEAFVLALRTAHDSHTMRWLKAGPAGPRCEEFLANPDLPQRLRAGAPLNADESWR
jgi:hypothetical protein